MNKSIRMAGTVLLVWTLVFNFAGIALGQETQQPEACQLLTRDEIQEAVGKDVSEGKLNTKANPLVGQPCQYTVATFGVFSILIKTAGPGETPDQMITELKKRKIPVSEAAAIGDRSFFSSPGYGMIQLNTFKGDKYLVITMLVPGASETAQKGSAEKLMRKALTRI